MKAGVRTDKLFVPDPYPSQPDPKANKKSPASEAIDTCHGYADSSTIHGISYACDLSSPNVHRLLWFLICIGMFVTALCLINQKYDEWQEKPVITSVQTTGNMSTRGGWGQGRKYYIEIGHQRAIY